MMKLGFFAILLACIAYAHSQESRIIGGGLVTDTTVPQFEFAASLQRIPAQTPQVIPPRHVCGGALITLGHVLTSATCCFEYGPGFTNPQRRVPGNFRVMAGIRNIAIEDAARTRPVQEFRPHEQFLHHPSHFNDIGIIILGNRFTELPRLTPISAIGNFVPFETMECHVAGFGSAVRAPGGQPNPPIPPTPSNELRFATKYIYNQQLCMYLHAIRVNTLNVLNSMICAAPFDVTVTSEVYDDGNVLVCNNLAVGVLTYYHGQQYGSFPEVYTRTANYTAWIRQISSANVAMPGAIVLFITAILTIFSQ